MTLSVNTNAGAAIALQSLNLTTRSLERTQLNISTGLRVNGPKDDASTFAIAQNLRGEVSGLNAVKTALANGEATVNVAIDAGTSVSDLLTEMKAKRSEEHTSELQSLMRSSYAVFCLTKKKNRTIVKN